MSENAKLNISRFLDYLIFPMIGLSVMLFFWWLGGYAIANNPDTSSFSDFAPIPTFKQFSHIISNGEVWGMAWPSLYRIGFGLFWAIIVGVPLGIMLGAFSRLHKAAYMPFQFLRMISPLAWMPIAVLVYATWDSAIIFLIWIAALWPITFATANGYSKMNPLWFKVAKNLGASPFQVLTHIIIRAISQDVLTGFRLSLGVAWIVIVPAEYLGVTNGLGYAINDARDTLEYDRLTAIILIIGCIGFVLDALCVFLIRKSNWIKRS